MGRSFALAFALFLPAVGALSLAAAIVFRIVRKRQQAQFVWVFGSVLLLGCMLLNIVSLPVPSEGSGRVIGLWVSAALNVGIAVFLLVRRDAILAWVTRRQEFAAALSEPPSAHGFRVALLVTAVWLLVGAVVAVGGVFLV